MKKTTDQHLASIESLAIELRHLLKGQAIDVRRKATTIANVAHVARISLKDVVATVEHLTCSNHGFKPDACSACAEAQRLIKPA